MSHNQRGRNACQANIGGTGIGGFNDRIRDALLGGSPFASPQHQGWVTGLGTQPSEFTKVTHGSPIPSPSQNHPVLSSGAAAGVTALQVQVHRLPNPETQGPNGLTKLCRLGSE